MERIRCGDGGVAGMEKGRRRRGGLRWRNCLVGSESLVTGSNICVFLQQGETITENFVKKKCKGQLHTLTEAKSSDKKNKVNKPIPTYIAISLLI